MNTLGIRNRNMHVIIYDTRDVHRNTARVRFVTFHNDSGPELQSTQDI